MVMEDKSTASHNSYMHGCIMYNMIILSIKHQGALVGNSYCFHFLLVGFSEASDWPLCKQDAGLDELLV